MPASQSGLACALSQQPCSWTKKQTAGTAPCRHPTHSVVSCCCHLPNGQQLLLLLPLLFEWLLRAASPHHPAPMPASSGDNETDVVCQTSISTSLTDVNPKSGRLNDAFATPAPDTSIAKRPARSARVAAARALAAPTICNGLSLANNLRNLFPALFMLAHLLRCPGCMLRKC